MSQRRNYNPFDEDDSGSGQVAPPAPRSQPISAQNPPLMFDPLHNPAHNPLQHPAPPQSPPHNSEFNAAQNPPALAHNQFPNAPPVPPGQVHNSVHNPTNSGRRDDPFFNNSGDLEDMNELVKSVLDFNPEDFFPPDINRDLPIPAAKLPASAFQSDQSSPSSSSSSSSSSSKPGPSSSTSQVPQLPPRPQSMFSDDSPLQSSLSATRLTDPEPSSPFSATPLQRSATVSHVNQRVFGKRDLAEEEMEAETLRSVSLVAASFQGMPENQRADYLESLLMENRELKAQLAKQRREQAEMSTATGCVNMMMLGKPVVLSNFKSLQDKLAMLDYACDFGAGDAVLDLTIFLKSTIKFSRFCELMKTRPVAVDTLLVYLKRHYEFDEVSKIQLALGRIVDEGLFLWWRAHRIASPPTRHAAFENCLSFMNKHPTLFVFERQQLIDQIELLRRQIIIETHDAKLAQTEEIFLKFPRQSIINKSVVATLGYCSFYHYTAGEQYESSPQGIRKQFRLTDKQFLWVAIIQRAKFRDWLAVQDLVTHKGFTSLFSSSKFISPIGFEPLVFVTSAYGAPAEVVAMYAREIKDVSKRLEISEGTALHEVVIECLVELRLRTRLIEYRNRPELRTPNYAMLLGRIDAILRDTKMKWRD